MKSTVHLSKEKLFLFVPAECVWEGNLLPQLSFTNIKNYEFSRNNVHIFGPLSSLYPLYAIYLHVLVSKYNIKTCCVSSKVRKAEVWLQKTD